MIRKIHKFVIPYTKETLNKIRDQNESSLLAFLDTSINFFWSSSFFTLDPLSGIDMFF